MNDYDVSAIFKEMEDYLLSSMSRNMQRHTNWENDEGFQWEMWQAKQLETLNEYRKQNKRYVNEQSKIIKARIDELLRQSNDHGGMQQEIKILEAIKKGFKPRRTPKGIKGSFFKLNERKLNALIRSVNADMDKALHATLRMINDEYRKTIHKAQMFANTGTMTTDQAIDMATKDFLAKGINCIEYKDGKRVNIASYAEMAIRTANKRAYLQGEGSKRDEWGIHTVLVSRYGACSETCLPWQGKVYIDDVWSGGTAVEAEKTDYPLLSTAIAGGLFHPNCKHTMSTYFEGITTISSKTDVKGTRENSNLVATQRYNERMIRKYKRLENGSLDKQNKTRYGIKRREWQSRQKSLIDSHPEMHRNYKRESLRGVNKVDCIEVKETNAKAELQDNAVLTPVNLLDKMNMSLEDAKEFDDFEETVSKKLKFNKPIEVISKKDFDSYQGISISRVMSDYHGKTAKEILKQTIAGDISYSKKWNNTYGRGIYFGDSDIEDTLTNFYGGKEGSTILKAKIVDTAKIKVFDSQQDYVKDLVIRERKLPKDLQALYKFKRSLYYMLDGYDGIYIKSKGYYCIYNRGVLITYE